MLSLFKGHDSLILCQPQHNMLVATDSLLLLGSPSLCLGSEQCGSCAMFFEWTSTKVTKPWLFIAKKRRTMVFACFCRPSQLQKARARAPHLHPRCHHRWGRSDARASAKHDLWAIGVCDWVQVLQSMPKTKATLLTEAGKVSGAARFLDLVSPESCNYWGL